MSPSACSPPTTASTWEKRSTIIASYDDVPSEAELQFFGDNQDTAVALVRLDNQDILDNGQTAICTAQEPFDTWECGRRIAQRLDGPTWVVRPSDGDGAQLRLRAQAPAVHVQAHGRLRAARRPCRPRRADRGVRDSGAAELGRYRLHLARAHRPGSLPAGLVQQRGRHGSAVAAGHQLAERHLARRRRLSPGPRRLRAAATAPALRAAAAAARGRRSSTSPARIS